jgi:hypothetical protein
LTGNKSKAVVDEAHNWEQYRKNLISAVRTRSTQQNAKTKFSLHFKQVYNRLTEVTILPLSFNYWNKFGC